MIVNGVTLPDIPAEVLEQYPYIFITHGESTLGTEAYTIIASATEFLHMSPDIFPDIEEGLYCLSDSKMIDYDSDEAAWNEDGSVLPVMTNLLFFQNAGIGTMTIVYSNYDIYTVASINADTEEFTKGEIYFPNSEAEEEPEETKPPRYSIATAILDAVARQIMRLTDSTAKVKPEEFEPKLEGINIQLQELTVTATEEVQTITPPSGVYGFSKVIVEAVEDSGTSGGGGTPGEGGDGDNPGGDTGEDEYAPAEDVAFGYEFDETPTETGYSYYNGNKLHTLSTDLPYVYIRTRTDTNAIFATASGAPFTQSAGSTTMQMRSSVPVTVENWNYSSSSGWKLSSSTETTYTSFPMSSPFEMYWCNEDVKTSTNADATVQHKGTAAIPETEGQYSGNYTQNDGTYTIEGSTLNELGGLVQKLTGTNETMTTAEMVAALRKLAGEEETTE